MVRMQSIDLKASVATTQDGHYIGLLSTDKTIIRALRSMNDAFKAGKTNLVLVYDGSNLEIRSNDNKCEYCDMMEEYKHVKIIGADKKQERRTVKEKTAKTMIKEIDQMHLKEKRKRKRLANKKAKEAAMEKTEDVIDETVHTDKPTGGEIIIAKPKRKRRTKAEMEEARRLEKITKEESQDGEPKVKPKRKRRTKAEMEEARRLEKEG